MNGDIVMGTFEEERTSGLDESDARQIWNIMHGFWLRFIVAGGTTSVWWIMCVRMSMYGITTSMLCVTAAFIAVSAIADGLNSMGYSSFVYPELDFIYYALIGGLVIITAIFASIMPARKALKFNPAKAVRHDV